MRFIAIILVACATPRAVPPTLPSADAYREWWHEPLSAHVGLCVAPDGDVTAVRLARSSGEPHFDAAVVHDVRHWQLSPTGRASCSAKLITYVP